MGTHRNITSSWKSQLVQMNQRATERVKPRARRIMAATLAVLWSTARSVLFPKAEGKTRKLDQISLGRLAEMLCFAYPDMIINAERFAAVLQYHFIWSLSL